MFDIDFPTLLGAELLRPDGTFISKFVVQPMVVHDFNAFPGGSVQLDRYSYWEDNSFSEANRLRNPNQIIGTTGSRDIPKNKIIVTLDEFTGPSAGADNPNDPGNLKIPIHNIITAQRLLYDMGNAQAFHQSIGSLTLVRDFRKWQDRVYVNRLLSVTSLGSASSTQGGYWNPGGVLNAGTYGAGPPRFDITNDLLTVVADMRTRNVPPFPSPYGPVYHNLSSPVFMKHLRANSDFREVAKFPGAVPVSMLQPGMMPMSAPQMPPPGNFMSAPNQMLFMGQGYGQSGFMSGDVLPTGFVFEGVRFFESTNLPTASITLNYTAAPTGITTGSAARTAFLGLFFGQQAVGEGVWGNGPEVKLNENSDYKRFIIAIWSVYAGFALLNDSFCTVGRTYQS